MRSRPHGRPAGRGRGCAPWPMTDLSCRPRSRPHDRVPASASSGLTRAEFDALVTELHELRSTYQRELAERLRDARRIRQPWGQRGRPRGARGGLGQRSTDRPARGAAQVGADRRSRVRRLRLARVHRARRRRRGRDRRVRTGRTTQRSAPCATRCRLDRRSERLSWALVRGSGCASSSPADANARFESSTSTQQPRRADGSARRRC